MARFCMHISGGKEARVEIDAENAHEAINSAMNALSQFASLRFPPPELLSIAVVDEAGRQLAMLSLSFKIEYADHLV